MIDHALTEAEKHRRPEGYYLCAKCGKETTPVIRRDEKGHYYQWNACYDCEWATGPVYRPDLDDSRS